MRFLRIVHVPSESRGESAFGAGMAQPCAQQDTKIGFSKQPGPSRFCDILAAEVDTDPARERQPVTERSDTPRFDGHRYQRFDPRVPSAEDASVN